MIVSLWHYPACSPDRRPSLSCRARVEIPTPYNGIVPVLLFHSRSGHTQLPLASTAGWRNLLPAPVPASSHHQDTMGTVSIARAVGLYRLGDRFAHACDSMAAVDDYGQRRHLRVRPVLQV